MKTAWLVVVAACGGAPAENKPVENVIPKPAYTCATAVDATVKTVALGADKERVRADLEGACTSSHWPDAYLQCTSAGIKPCDDTRTPAQKAHALFTVSCTAYAAAIEALSHCEKMPQASRDAMKQGLEAMKMGMDFTTLPPDARMTAEQASTSACKQASDAIDAASKAVGC